MSNVYEDQYESEQLGKVTCEGCGYSSTDELTLAVMNDQTGVCPVCDSGALVWLTVGEMSNG